MTQPFSNRSAAAGYAHARPISYLLSVTLVIYGAVRLLDDLTGGAPLVTPRWIAIRVLVALAVAALVTLFVRRRARRSEPAAT